MADSVGKGAKAILEPPRVSHLSAGEAFQKLSKREKRYAYYVAR
jgi:hypothetical protein